MFLPVIAALILAAPVAALAEGPVHSFGPDLSESDSPCPADAEDCDTVALVDEASRFHVRERMAHRQPVHAFFFGEPGDVPLMGDWDCDGESTPAMYRPSNGFAYFTNRNQSSVATTEFFYGLPSDVPVAGDWDGDGCDTIAIYRPSEGRAFLRNSLSTGVADRAFYFGRPGDEPFAGDFDGDGSDTLGLYRRSTGFVYFRNENSHGTADYEFFYGAPGDEIMAGDWDGDGVDTLGVYRPVDETLYLTNRTGSAQAEYEQWVGSFADAVSASSIDFSKIEVQPPPEVGYFATLPPGSALPSGDTCAELVRPAAEIRPDNAVANNTRASSPSVVIDGGSSEFNSRYASRIDGDFSGTTDEIIQWAACKWGFDEDLTRARAVVESSWKQSQLGDETSSASQCGSVGFSAPCYQSYGLLQVKVTVHEGTWPYAATSTAFNADYSLAWLRACYEGDFTWLGSTYGPGDERGCVGAWFSGRWYAENADYIDEVYGHLSNRFWEDPVFIQNW